MENIAHLSTREEWLAQRIHGIGGSDARRVLFNPYPLWAEKSGLIEPDDLSGLEWIEWGHRLEGVIAEAYAEKSGRTVERWPQFDIAYHPQRRWMFCTPDAIQRDPDRQDDGVLQIKTTGAFLAAEWEDEPPLGYQVHVMHEMEVLGLNWGTLVVLIGGQRLRWYDLDRNAGFVEQLIATEQDFWRRVQEGDPPPVDDSAATTDALKKLYPIDNGETIALPPAAIAWDEELLAVKAQLKDLTAQRALLENQIKQAIGDATAGMLSDGTTYTHKVQTTNYPAREPSTATFRVLRRRESK